MSKNTRVNIKKQHCAQLIVLTRNVSSFSQPTLPKPALTFRTLVLVMSTSPTLAIATELLDILPNPVLVKNEKLEYVFINAAFESLFSVKRTDVIGQLDADLFPNRQVSQCNGGDLRVLANGEVDEAVETVFEESGNARETITRKSKLTTADGSVYLVGVMHDITDVTRANTALKESESKLQEQAITLQRMASTDHLTGCNNRRALAELSKPILANQFTSSALLLLDLDNFKHINDTHGHDIGDAALCHFADEINEALDGAHHFARLGGEEFVILLNGAKEDQAIDKAEELRKRIAASSMQADGKPLKFTVSIGIATKQKGEKISLEELLQIADVQLYEAKNRGRNRVVAAC